MGISRRQGPGPRAAFPRPVQRARLLHHPGELFDEQRHTARPVVDLVDHRLRHGGPDFLPHQVTGLAPGQAVQGQAGLVGDRGPGRLELGPEGEQREDRVVQALGEELAQELQGRRVHPVQVLDDEQDRLPGGACAATPAWPGTSLPSAGPATARGGNGPGSAATTVRPTAARSPVGPGHTPPGDGAAGRTGPAAAPRGRRRGLRS